LTEVQRDAINNQTNGLILYNTDENRINLYDGYVDRWIDTSQPVTSVAAPASPYPGQLWMKVPDYELFVYDAVRAKWLSSRMISTTASRRSNNASNIYLRAADRSPTNLHPFVLPFDATLVGISASGELAQTWTLQVRTGGTPVPGATLAISSASAATDYTLNVDFAAGSAVQMYLSSGSGISNPRASLFFARRGS
jgi:hypothetical protein